MAFSVGSAIPIGKYFRSDRKHHGLVVSVTFSLFMVLWTSLSLIIRYHEIKETFDRPTTKPIDYNERMLRDFSNWTRDYIDQTSPNDRLYNQLKTVSSLPLLRELRNLPKDVVWPKSNRTICAQQLDLIELDLSKQLGARGLASFQLRTILESYGHALTGFHRGIRTSWFGSPRRCLASKFMAMRFCMGEFRVISQNQIVVDEFPSQTIKIGLCIPEACQANLSSEFKRRFQSISSLNVVEKYASGLQLEDIICLPDESSIVREFPLSGWLFLAFCAIWLMFVIASSLLHLLRDRFKVELVKSFHVGTFIDIFSIGNSIKRFSSNGVQTSGNREKLIRVDLAWLNYIRIILALSVIFHHSYGMLEYYIDSPGTIARFLSSLQYIIPVQVSMRALDIFLVMFGLFYTLKLNRTFNGDHKEAWSFWSIWLKTNVDIFTRVGPVYMFLQLYERLVAPYMGSGFRWKYGLNVDSCPRSSFLELIPYLAQRFPCNSHVWYVHVYVCIGLVLPFIVYVISRLHKYSHKLLFVMLIWSLSQLNLIFILLMIPKWKLDQFAFRTESYLYDDNDARFYNYFDVLTRIGAVAFACFIGHLLYLYQTKMIKQWPIRLVNRLTASLLTLLLILNCLVPVLSHIIKAGENPSRLHVVTSYLLTFGCWPIVSSLAVLFVSTYGNSSIWVKSFMNHPFFHSFSKLTFVMYMVQNEVLSQLTGSLSDELEQRGKITIGLYINCIILIDLLVAVPIHLLFEDPMQKLISTLRSVISMKALK